MTPSPPTPAPDRSWHGADLADPLSSTGAEPPPSPLPPPRPPFGLGERVRARLAEAELSPGRVAGAVAGVAAVVVVALWLLRAPPPPIEDRLPMAPGVASATTVRAAGSEPGPDEASPSSELPGSPGSATPGSATPGSAPGEGPSELVVHAAGAVARPGLYRLPPGSRTADVVDAAGGLALDADIDRLNLAALLADGARVWVPRRGEATPPPAVNGDGGAAPSGAGGAPAPGGGTVPSNQPVDLNTATLDQLDTLPGVGPATAQAIVDHRTEHGPFQSVDDLLEVRGIGEAKLADLRDRVRV